MHPHTVSGNAHGSTTGPPPVVPGYHYNRVIAVHHKHLCKKTGTDMPKIAQEKKKKKAVMPKAKRLAIR